MPLIIQQQKNQSILQGSQQQMQQRPYIEENCTCAKSLAKTNSISSSTPTIIATAVTATTANFSNSINRSSSNGNGGNITMNQMPFKRVSKSAGEALPPRNYPLSQGLSECGSISTNTKSNTSLAATTNSKISQFPYCVAELPALGTILPSSSVLLVSNNSSPTTTSSWSSSSSSPSPTCTSPSPLSSSVYLEMKKYCRRFLIVISLICLLHSCLLWNTAAAAISNRGKLVFLLVRIH